jgi:hypothetical protein
VHPKREKCTLIVKTVGGTKRRIFVSFDTCSDQHHRDFFLSEGRKSDATWHVSFTSEPFGEQTAPWVAATFRSADVLKEIQLAQVLGAHLPDRSRRRVGATSDPGHEPDRPVGLGRGQANARHHTAPLGHRTRSALRRCGYWLGWRSSMHIDHRTAVNNPTRRKTLGKSQPWPMRG